MSSRNDRKRSARLRADHLALQPYENKEKNRGLAGHGGPEQMYRNYDCPPAPADDTDF